MTVKRTKEKTIVTHNDNENHKQIHTCIQSNKQNRQTDGRTISVTVTAKSNSIMVVNNIDEKKNIS